MAGTHACTHTHAHAHTHTQKSLVGYNPQGHKESVMTERLSTHTHTQSMAGPLSDMTGVLIGRRPCEDREEAK